jgi:G3E family GTPase
MGEFIDVLLITGFLGSGKTTFLNLLMEHVPKHYKIVILMNEFGEIGIDGSLIVGEGYEMLEISKGSIFCICVKTDFIKAMHRIAHNLRPDLLIIESTGVANPTDLKKDLNLAIFNGRFRLHDQVCIVDPTTFEEAYGVYTSIEKQIESSTSFIINKIDIATQEGLHRVKNIISKHHPNPIFFETTFCKVSIDEFLPTLEKSSLSPLSKFKPAQDLAPQELDEIIEKIFSDSNREITPPDLLISETFFWRGNGIEEFTNVIDALPPGIVRGKGYVWIKEKVYLFNSTMGRWGLEVISFSKNLTHLSNKMVFIYPPDLSSAMDDFLRIRPQLQRISLSQKKSPNDLIRMGL